MTASLKSRAARAPHSPSRNREGATSLLGPIGFVLVLGLLSACSGHHSTAAAQADEPIPECDAFLVSYEHCLESLGPVDLAHARVEQSRASFESTHGEAARAELRQKCADNLAQLKKTCR